MVRDFSKGDSGSVVGYAKENWDQRIRSRIWVEEQEIYTMTTSMRTLKHTGTESDDLQLGVERRSYQN